MLPFGYAQGKLAQHDNQLNKICNGPGTVSQGLGIKKSHTKTDLFGKTIWIEDRGIKISKNKIIKNPRIGVDYAGADALLPYRFTLKI
jgi:DNA-3-methyladenine glycosylase